MFLGVHTIRSSGKDGSMARSISLRVGITTRTSNVAVGVRFTACMGAEQNDLLRPKPARHFPRVIPNYRDRYAGTSVPSFCFGRQVPGHAVILHGRGPE